jgi:hypothetical protein
MSEKMRPALREVLADSQIAAVAIAILLVWSLNSGVRAIGPPLLSVVNFLVTMVAIRDIPSGFYTFSLGYWLTQISTFTHFLDAVISLSAAWVLSRWVYKLGPCRSLIECRARLARRKYG